MINRFFYLFCLPTTASLTHFLPLQPLLERDYPFQLLQSHLQSVAISSSPLTQKQESSANWSLQAFQPQKVKNGTVGNSLVSPFKPTDIAENVGVNGCHFAETYHFNVFKTILNSFNHRTTFSSNVFSSGFLLKNAYISH